MSPFLLVGWFQVVIFSNIPDEVPETELRSREFIVAPTTKLKSDATDETDALCPAVVEYSSAIKISQRDPLMTMKVVTKVPVLVGEWFIITIHLDNQEVEDDARHVEILASLVDAGDPIIADTTRISFDTSLSDEPMTPISTPSSEEQKSFETVPPLVKKIGIVAKGTYASS